MPATVDLVGYRTVLAQGDFLLYFQNSLIVTLASLAAVLLFGAMAASRSRNIASAATRSWASTSRSGAVK